MESLRWLWQYIKKHKLKIIFAFFLVLICSASNIITPYLAGKIVDDVILKNSRSLLMPLLAAMIAVTAAKSILRYVFIMIFERVSQDMIFQIRDDMYKKMQGLDFTFFNKTRTGDIMTRMTGDTDTVRHFISWVDYTVFENVAIFISAIGVMFYISIKLTFLMLCITPVIGFFAFKMTKDVGPTFQAIREQFSRLNTVVQENISGNRVVKAFAKEDYEIEKFSIENQKFMDRNMESAMVWEKYLPILDSLAGLLSVVMILAGGIMVINKSLTMGQLIMFNGLIWALNNPMRMTGWLINDVQRFFASSEKIILLLNTKSKIKNSNAKLKKNRINGEIEFKDVSFSYGDEPVLKNISFKANPGETVAIVGATGSGKSTLVSLISRFYNVSAGEILIDGVKIKDYNLNFLRDCISFAMQDIFLFSDTIEGNIAYGKPDASFDEVQFAAESAGAHSFISGFQDGYDTIIGERGVGLSGGQKQRIALARAIIKNPSILVLDDTTSSVDVETEHKIQNALNDFYKDKTCFIISHRISSVKNADLILVIDNGEIIERGTHQELLDKKGYYYGIYANQAGEFDKKEARGVV